MTTVTANVFSSGVVPGYRGRLAYGSLEARAWLGGPSQPEECSSWREPSWRSGIAGMKD